MGTSETKKPSLFERFLTESEHEVGEDDNLSTPQHLIAGAVAGITEHCLIFPIDTIKTHMQFCQNTGITSACESAPVSPKGFTYLVKELVKIDGFKRLFRGVSAMALGAGPSHAVHFGIYEFVRSRMLNASPDHRLLASASAGAAATIASDALLTPMDTIKQHMQMQKSSQRQNVFRVVQQIIKKEGFVSLYASYKTTIIMNIPFSAIQFGTYHALKDYFSNFESRIEPSSKESIVFHWFCGGVSGAVAAAFTTPLDVIRTALQTQGLCGRMRETRFKGMSDVAHFLYKRGGWRVFTTGMFPRVLFHFPGAAICWSSYEYCKDILYNFSH